MPSLDMAPNVGHVSYKRSSISKATNLACGWVPTSMNYPISPALPGADEAAVDTAREAAPGVVLIRPAHSLAIALIRRHAGAGMGLSRHGEVQPYSSTFTTWAGTGTGCLYAVQKLKVSPALTP